MRVVGFKYWVAGRERRRDLGSGTKGNWSTRVAYATNNVLAGLF